MSISENKEKALASAMTQVERQFGKGTVMRMGDREHVAIPAISTGSLGLDVALGIGGLPKGRICERISFASPPLNNQFDGGRLSRAARAFRILSRGSSTPRLTSRISSWPE